MPTRIAIIPARGGSKRLPRKNVLLLAGMPLIAHSIRHARASALIDEVIVSTDDPEIAEVAREEGASVVMRPVELASDTATSESALLHILDARKADGQADPDLVVFLQCTSPVREPDDIDRAIETLEREKADSLLSVCENTRFVWAAGKDGPRSLNYDFKHRRREQDLDPQFQENGSIYLSRAKLLRETGNRLGGRIALHVMDYWNSFQIDSPEDLELVRWIMSWRTASAGWPAELKLIVFDFDGVMTDNRVLVGDDGSEAVLCNRGDGMGLEMLRRRGVPMLVLSKEANPVVSARCAKLKLPCVQGIDDKRSYLEKHLSEQRINAASVAYVGNDINDLPCLDLVGFPVVVRDAHPDVLGAAKLVLTRDGGHGAVREFCDLAIAHLDKGARLHAESR